ncbi:MAG: hypothetical protein ACTSWI_06755, partial [Alphaproteobacteria bacterium]
EAYAESQVQGAIALSALARVVVENLGGDAADIVVTGHSMGGTLAQIVGQETFPQLVVHTYSAPGAERLASQTIQGDIGPVDNENIFNHIRVGDFIAAGGGDHFGQIIVYDRLGLIEGILPSVLEGDFGDAATAALFRNHLMEDFNALLNVGAIGYMIDDPTFDTISLLAPSGWLARTLGLDFAIEVLPAF